MSFSGECGVFSGPAIVNVDCPCSRGQHVVGSDGYNRTTPEAKRSQLSLEEGQTGEGRRGAVEQPPAKKVKQVCNCIQTYASDRLPFLCLILEQIACGSSSYRCFFQLFVFSFRRAVPPLQRLLTANSGSSAGVAGNKRQVVMVLQGLFQKLLLLSPFALMFRLRGTTIRLRPRSRRAAAAMMLTLRP